VTTRRAGELRDYYEAEATLRTRNTLSLRRVAAREAFIALITAERRTTVLDIGAGPGLDGSGFTAAGLRYVGVDLAAGNGRIARGRGVVVIQATATNLPFRDGSFDAGWSMSALMHLRDLEVLTTLANLAGTLSDGAPCLFGMWGGSDDVEVEVEVDDRTIRGQRRRFHRRSLDHAVSLVEQLGPIERCEVWKGDDAWDYQVVLARARRR